MAAGSAASPRSCSSTGSRAKTDSTYKIEVESFADTQRAMRLIRSRAAEWNIDPARLGAMGFSAGGELVSTWQQRASTRGSRSADRSDRAAALEADVPGADLSGPLGATSSRRRTSPPAFLAAAYNDRQDISEGLAEAYLRFKRAGVPAELHIYGTGGHGFGLRATNAVRSASGWCDSRSG